MSLSLDVTDPQPGWLLRAWTELGQSEAAGALDNPRIIAFYKEIGHSEIHHDDVAWCSAFVGACLERAGHLSTRSLLARSYSTWGQTLSKPRLGCICVFTRGENRQSGHVGFWVGEAAGNVLLLGGNQGGSVSVIAIARTRLIAIRWPLMETPPEVNRRTGPQADSAFETGLAHVLALEGGYSDDPFDPGGPTNQGITLADYADYVGTPVTAATRERLTAGVRNIDPAAVRAIYLERYWGPSHAGELSPAIALMHFDTAVNQGLGTGARLLQRALDVAVDGEIGPLTLQAAATAQTDIVLEGYAELRRDRYRSLHHFGRFGRGWLRRVDTTLQRAKTLITSQTARPHDHVNSAEGQPPYDQSVNGEQSMAQSQSSIDNAADPEATKWWGHSLTIWGSLLTAATTVLPVIAPLLGLDLSAEIVRQLGDQSMHVAQAIGGLVGTLMALYGRSRASTRLERREVRLQL